MKLFFERLTDRGPITTREAIAENVQRVVVSLRTSPRDGVIGVQDFGLPSPPELNSGFGPSETAYLERLQELVERFEPRLVNVRVSAEAAGEAVGPFRAVITAELGPGAEAETVHFAVG